MSFKMLSEYLFSGNVVTTFVIAVSFAVLLYRYSVRNYDYWKKRGIPSAKTFPFMGSVREVYGTTFQDLETRRYRELGPVYGHFEGNKPLLSVGDPALLRDILVKDFQYFGIRRKVELGDKILENIMSIAHGETWKRMRTIVSPTFSTVKMKRMLGIFNDCSRTVTQNFRTYAEKGETVGINRLFGAFTMDVIASSAFSTKLDSHNDPNNKFVQTATDVFKMKLDWKALLFIVCPSLVKLLRLRLFFPEAVDFFSEMTLQIIQERKRTGQVRNDFLQLLMDTAKEVSEDDTGDAQEKDESEKPHIFKNYTTNKHLSSDELVAQCVIFFLAGYDTTSSSLTFATYLLALHPEIQDKVRQEVDQALKDAQGELTYEAIQSMKYMDKVISETLRLYSPAIRLERTAEANYKLGETGIVVPKDMMVTMPIYAIHRDPKYFPEPERFIPERFNAEEKAKRNPYTYMPFGSGPRNCVAVRFAILEMKSCLAHLIANFTFQRCQQTKVPLEFHTGGQGLLQAKEVVLKIEARTDTQLS